MGLASHAGVFRGARFSSIPTNACSTENKRSFPIVLFAWQVTNQQLCNKVCGRAKRYFNVTLELPFSFFLSSAKVMQCMEYSKIYSNPFFAALHLTFTRSENFPSVSYRSSNYQITSRSRSTFQNLESTM